MRLKAISNSSTGKIKPRRENTCGLQTVNRWKVTLTTPKITVGEDKRLEIDLEGLRHYLWVFPDGTPKNDIKDGQTSMVKWIDTSVMLCDPLTKEGKPGFANRLIEAYTTGVFSTRPTAESEMRKMKAQKARKVTREKTSKAKDAFTREDNDLMRLAIKDHHGRPKVFRDVHGTYSHAYNLPLALGELDTAKYQAAKRHNMLMFERDNPEFGTQPN